ncbi:unnamed protein product [Closterium sp. NIES-65]|nr:unnamed protein product [Closterium sp. NIES-65]
MEITCFLRMPSGVCDTVSDEFFATDSRSAARPSSTANSSDLSSPLLHPAPAQPCPPVPAASTEAGFLESSPSAPFVPLSLESRPWRDQPWRIAFLFFAILTIYRALRLFLPALLASPGPSAALVALSYARIGVAVVAGAPLVWIPLLYVRQRSSLTVLLPALLAFYALLYFLVALFLFSQIAAAISGFGGSAASSHVLTAIGVATAAAVASARALMTDGVSSVVHAAAAALTPSLTASSSILRLLTRSHLASLSLPDSLALLFSPFLSANDRASLSSPFPPTLVLTRSLGTAAAVAMLLIVLYILFTALNTWLAVYVFASLEVPGLLTGSAAALLTVAQLLLLHVLTWFVVAVAGITGKGVWASLAIALRLLPAHLLPSLALLVFTHLLMAALDSIAQLLLGLLVPMLSPSPLSAPHAWVVGASFTRLFLSSILSTAFSTLTLSLLASVPALYVYLALGERLDARTGAVLGPQGQEENEVEERGGPPVLLSPGELAGQQRTGPTGPPPPWGARWPAPHRTHRSSSPLGSSLASTAQDPPVLLPTGDLAGQHRRGPTGPPLPWGARWPAPHWTHRPSSPLGSSLASTAQDPPVLLPPGELAGQHRTGPTGPPPPSGARWPAPHRTHRSSSPLGSSLANTARERMGLCQLFAAVFLRRWSLMATQSYGSCLAPIYCDQR